MYTLVYPIAMGVSIVAEKGICPNLLENISGEEPLTIAIQQVRGKAEKTEEILEKLVQLLKTSRFLL